MNDGCEGLPFFFVFLLVSRIERACTTLRSGRVCARGAVSKEFRDAGRVGAWKCGTLADVSHSVLPVHLNGNWRGCSDWPVDVLAIPYQVLAVRIQKVGGDWEVFRGLVVDAEGRRRRRRRRRRHWRRWRRWREWRWREWRRRRRWRERRWVAGEEQWEPLRRARAGVVGLRLLARHTGLRDVREEGGAKGRGDADEDDRTAARSVHLCLRLRWGDLGRARCGDHM